MVNVLRPLTDRPLGDFAAELMVLDLYRQQQISSGKAVELLEIERIEFIRFAGRQGIAFFDMSEDHKCQLKLIERVGTQDMRQ